MPSTVLKEFGERNLCTMRNWLLLCEDFFNRFDVATNPGLLFETSERSWIDGVMCMPCHQEVGPPTCALRFKLNPKVVFCLTWWNVIPILLKASYPNNRFIQASKGPYRHSAGKKKKKVSHIFPYTSVSYSFLEIFIYGYVCVFFHGICYICAGAHRSQQRESGAEAEVTGDWVIPKVDARKKMHVLQKNKKYSQNIKTSLQPLLLFLI